ncbi:hypothetical protein C8J56DRAFT_1070062 [Mycena floridula]|nr:hypothetical protein C8J56DRAFT_1070062 [Mycena floridula]
MSELKIGYTTVTFTEPSNWNSDRPIWPLILWIVFTELAGNDRVSSLVEFVEQQPEEYSCQDNHDQWLLGRFRDSDSVAARQGLLEYTSRFKECRDWEKLRGLSNCRKSRSLESISDVASPTSSLSMVKDIRFLAAKLGTLLPFSPFPSHSRDFAQAMSLSESVPGKSIQHVGDVLSRAIRELPPELAFEYPRSWLCGRKTVLGLLERDTNFSNSSMIPLWIQYTAHDEARCGPEMRPLDVIATLAAYASRTEEMLQWISSLPERALDVAKLTGIL